MYFLWACRIFLEIRDELAEVALRQLGREDVIYAWGVLSSYDKIIDGGKSQIFHKVDEIYFLDVAKS